MSFKKRRREQPAVDTQLIEIYEDLTNVDEKVRLKACRNLLVNFVPEGTANGDQLNEILRRLFRGLCSGRKAARLGFSVALTEFLTRLLGSKGQNVPGFQGIPDLIDTLQNQTHISGNVSGQVRLSEDHQ
jgi:DNA polymerase phi